MLLKYLESLSGTRMETTPFSGSLKKIFFFIFTRAGVRVRVPPGGRGRRCSRRCRAVEGAGARGRVAQRRRVRQAGRRRRDLCHLGAQVE